MKRPQPRDIAASVRGRLLSISKERKEAFEFTLTRYATERFLYRLSRSPHRDRFILKGATLFVYWTGTLHRPTRDLDLLGFGDQAPAQMANVIKAICAQEVEPDGLLFLEGSVRAEAQREAQEYEGLRIHLLAALDTARIPLQIDIGFGDAVTPKPEEIELPTYLDQPAPRLTAYPRETVVAEKTEALVDLGIANSRLKDFYDLWYLSRRFDFQGSTLAHAIAATFERRGTKLPNTIPIALTEDYTHDDSRRRQWMAFLNRSGITREQPPDLKVVCEAIAAFLMPVFSALTAGEEFNLRWSFENIRWE